jgi:hypothetical protein
VASGFIKRIINGKMLLESNELYFYAKRFRPEKRYAPAGT